MENKKDVLILGGGPAGLSCAIYSARAGLKTTIVEMLGMGGQASLTHKIDNYPGIPNIEGFKLGMQMAEQAQSFGVEVIYDEIKEIDTENKKVKLAYSDEVESKSIVLAMGASPRKINIDGEEKFTGRGVSYCAVCDGAFYKDKTVVVIGGGNTAVEDAMYLTKFAKKVYIIHRRDEFRASNYLSEMIKSSDVEIIWDSVPLSINGQDKAESITIKNVKTEEVKDIQTDGVFVAIGQVPRTDLVKDKVKLDKNGYILTDIEMETNIDGVYAAGDIRQKTLRQVITAAADGAIASNSATIKLMGK